MKQKNLLEHKVGIRILREDTLENIFPMYQSMMNKINECRRVASEKPKQLMKSNYQYNLMYDNVFSIFGKRGTGKTTVAFSLREMIEKNKGSTMDVVLPIIIPEVIPDNCTILGWILAIIKVEVERLEQQLKKQEENEEKEDYWRICRFSECTEKLSEKLSQLCRMVFASNYNPSNENSYYQAVGNSAVQAEEYYQFAVEIAEFWDMWLDVIRQINKQNSKKKVQSEPMIYFIFDDVDLAPEKIGELLSVIIKYLSHPNLIVITTADERLVLDVLENRLDRSIGKLPKEWRFFLSNQNNESSPYDENIETENNLVNETARMYMGKVMPPSMRFYLRTFTTASQKSHFLLEKSKTLGKGVRKEVEKLLDDVPDEKKQFACFMGEENKIRDFYLNFFGDTSRQIGNIYLGIRMLIENLREEISAVKDGKRKLDVYLSKIYEICRYFINLVIRTNHNLGSVIGNHMEIDRFVDEIFLTEYRKQSLYINYAYINEFEELYLEYGEQKRLAFSLQLFSLAAFMENILLILEYCTKYGVTGRNRIHVVRPFAEYLNASVFEGRDAFRDDFEADQFFDHYGFLLDQLDRIFSERDSRRRIDMEYFNGLQNELYGRSELDEEALVHMYQKNPGWFREIAGMIAMTYGGGYLIEEKVLKNSMFFWTHKMNLSYQTFAEQIFIQNIKDFVKEFDLYDFAKRQIQESWELSYDYDEEKYRAYILRLREELSEKMTDHGEDHADQQFVPLATILQNIVDAHGDKIGETLEHCPKEILDDLQETLGMIFYDDEDLQELLQKEMGEIEKMEGMVSYVAFYFPISWLEIIRELRRHSDSNIRKKVRRLNQLIGWIFSEEEIEITEQIIVPYRSSELQNLRTICSELASDLADDFEWENNHLGERLLDLFNDLDIAVDIDSPMELERAVITGFRLLIVKYLQRLYLSLKIVGRYENESVYSAKNIQWISDQEGERKTYYYQLFEMMKCVAEGGTQTGKQMARKMEELRNLINKITRDRRRNYIDELQRENSWTDTD